MKPRIQRRLYTVGSYRSRRAPGRWRNAFKHSLTCSECGCVLKRTAVCGDVTAVEIMLPVRLFCPRHGIVVGRIPKGADIAEETEPSYSGFWPRGWTHV